MRKIEIKQMPADCPDAKHCIGQYISELEEKFGQEFDPNAGNRLENGNQGDDDYFYIAYDEGMPVGCGYLIGLYAETAEIKRVWVLSSRRGSGIATSIMDLLENQAQKLGYRRICLDTNSTLTQAIKLYKNRGYVEIAPYNQNPYAHHWFEKQL